ncbi:MAG: nucleotidyltransferase family protein [Methanothrix sp.]|uniref:protein adenylyltransferase n=1 Tax=Methanothrix harundinacea TaxID=301375 RepID=A0A101IL57_9EURY|nr:MAG: DNA polymerase beta domain protein region [Methanothrix harundinacea]MDD2638054.1 nucleotidyltransferase family protein [Methanothrix sp.]MDI9398740.1 nucleotidyltransferase family protein [Euryarchaeota archaeon]KUK97244.1 MAG: DNA polymerase beta domain protein region [Methanothrix harundinacea]MDD3709281.1 nucleotidyltransferase family protein [Methanothrix sp.]
MLDGMPVPPETPEVAEGGEAEVELLCRRRRWRISRSRGPTPTSKTPTASSTGWAFQHGRTPADAARQVYVRWSEERRKPSTASKNADIINSYEYLNSTVNFMSDQMQAVQDAILDVLRKNGVKRAAFFGSIVRGEMNEESDIDILIEFEGRKSLLDLSHLKNELEDTVNRRVDLLTYRSLHPRLRDRILAEQVPIL